MSASYRLTGRVEPGDLAELYQATQEGGGSVVVKLFHAKTSDPAYARVLADTSRVLNPLRPTGIIPVVDMGFVRQRLAVVREHVEGFTLGTALQRLNTKEVLLPSALALHLVIQLLEAVQRAHEVGVVHGAITPGNLLLSRDGVPGICDFGALKALMAVPELKRAFATRGRSAYRAPEVGKGEEPSELSDIYSLGAIAYELLTLREALVVGSGLSTRRDGLPPPSRLDRRINSRLDPVILRALDPLPQRRFRSAGEFAGGLRNFLASHGGMPGVEDLRRFTRELVPNEVNFSTLGPVPFSEPFALTAVSGAEIAHLRAEPLDVSVVVRTPFSPALSEEETEAKTQEAAPAFEAYVPEASASLEPLRTGASAPVDENENTAPTPPSAQDVHWDAPAGPMASVPRKPLASPGGSTGAREGTRVGRNPRLKWVEDVPDAPERPAEEPPEEAATSVRKRLVAREAPAPVQPSAAKDRPEIPMPPPTQEGIPVAKRRRLFTEELNLLKTTRRQRRALSLAGAFALVGLFAFVLATWERPAPGDVSPAPPEAPPVAAQAGGPGSPLREPPPAQPIPVPPAPEPREQAVAEAPPVRAQAAFVTLRANAPARVFIDGVPLSRRTPLVRYPVKPGTRLIVLESVSTGERAEFRLHFERGKTRAIEQKFKPVPRR
ncbi:serine/threonine protein kinase [Stigmatella erecta]|uniref:Serine/threonine protein kinase n=1 Tax=Stigmatella erecta TaxID=83460 RepID=A0A1I0A7P4_9BACT|nr:serine/threonine-protein kinase [Stigmatella erecta]SES89713.1 serine/threonine protein kinase [Stigmatella erecta]